MSPESDAARELKIKPGDVLLEKYKVERVLGQGGMGVVMAVRHMELDQLFALKILLPRALESADAVDRFLREARASARLDGEHVAKVFDTGRLDGDKPYMIMEHLQGHDLKDLLQTRGPLPVEDAIEYVLQVCSVMGEAHKKNIVHRDLKPSNIFLTHRSNGSALIKVLDFGISKVISAEGAELTKSGAVLGSPLYMSPEQMMHTKRVGPTTDIWSLGVVLYELVTGKVPFEGETFTQIVSRVLSKHPKPPGNVRSDLPRWLDDVVLKCLRKAPNERFQTMADLADALRSQGKTMVS